MSFLTSRPMDWIFNPFPVRRFSDWFWKYGYRCIHDRHLNKVCTHMADLSTLKIKLLRRKLCDFWKNLLNLQQNYKADRNAKAEEKIKQLQEFVARFSANASKSKQATSRKNAWQDWTWIVPSSLEVPIYQLYSEKLVTISWQLENLSVKIDGETILGNISFILRPWWQTTLSDRTIFKQPLWSVHWWMIEHEVNCHGELQLADHI